MIILYFPSKKDIWISIPVWGTILFCLVMPFIGLESVGNQFITADSILGKVFLFVCVSPVIWMWFRTGYNIEDTKIKVRCGPLKWTININDIQQIHKVKTLFSSPALSINKLKITYGKYNEICISPKNEDDFLRLIMKENPRIQLDKRLVDDVKLND